MKSLRIKVLLLCCITLRDHSIADQAWRASKLHHISCNAVADWAP
jgi:hypothetical protein